MRIAVIDGQGGGLGKYIVERVRKEVGEEHEIVALGTNAVAASLMLRAGANEAASGENAIVFNADKVDLIIGTMAVIAANSMLGEMTPGMASAVSSSPAQKLLLPISRHGIEVVGAELGPLPHLLDKLVIRLKEIVPKQP